MQISEIEFMPVRARDGLVGFASLVFDNQLYLGNIAIYTRPSGDSFRCVFPTKRLNNDQELPIFHPISQDTGYEIEEAVSEKVRQVLAPDTNY